jgi:hypothetical protein
MNISLLSLIISIIGLLLSAYSLSRSIKIAMQAVNKKELEEVKEEMGKLKQQVAYLYGLLGIEKHGILF